MIGIAGTDEKCRWVESLGADVCLNYKGPTFEQDLLKATEGYVHLYFDNVGVRLSPNRDCFVVQTTDGLTGPNTRHDAREAETERRGRRLRIHFKIQLPGTHCSEE